jgi:tetratricopeptide (TPR) repeat protein
MSAATRLAAWLSLFEKQGNYRAALPYLEKMLELNPLAEEIHRQRMRCLYLAGDRASALTAYQQCQAVLKRELDVEPMPETEALAKNLEAGEVLAQVSARQPQLPLSILRPPRLVGHEAAWQHLEAAWTIGQGVALCGEPGVGKSRLMLDFVNSKGDYEMHEGRPGDQAVSYATYSRSLRRMLKKHPDIVLPPWVRQELSRLLPDLSDEPPPAITNETDKLRFFEGLVWMLETLVEQGLKFIIIDDLQFMDAATFEVAQYLFSRFANKIKTISSYRSHELSPAIAEAIEQAVQGVVTRIELQPLKAPELENLLQSLELENLPNPESLERFTGGNPLFVLETLKSLYEAGGSGTGKLPTSGKVKSLISSRLSRLSQSALNLARCAAVLGTDFSLELSADMMGQAPLMLAEPLEELERLQIMQQGRFNHDLLFETVLEGIPAPIKHYLHRQAAESLEKQQANPARIANHYLSANDQSKALPFLQQAAETAKRDFQFIDATMFYERLADILETQNKPDEAFEHVQKSI